ncbi:hypothetical protein DVH05_020149 [Phytophthora capsici]|nr:hypothetical protein DVH05_020149 [Phytophthora capsici]
MAPSMADHLLAQEYSRVRNAASAVLTEPTVSDEGAMQLEEAYERNDTSPMEYLSLVTAQRPFTPSSARHAVIIETGSYCSSTPLPVIFKSFLMDHGNEAVKEVLEEYGVALVEKIPSGGVLLHVRSLEHVQKLVGQEVMVLGRKFKIKRPSVFLNKFYLDVSGVHTTDEANELFLALCALGARPFFMTPRDVNLKSQVVTPTWRFYFGSEAAPACLQVHGFVTNQLAFGSHYYVAHGKQSAPPPARATTFRQSRYAVLLRASGDPHCRERNAQTPARAIETRTSSRAPKAKPKRDQVPAMASDESTAVVQYTDTDSHRTVDNKDEEDPRLVESTRLSPPTPPVEFPAVSQDDMIMDFMPDSDHEDQDVDMTRHLETGFKRIESSFADENPFDALVSIDCDFEVVQPEVPDDLAQGVLIVPHLRTVSTTPGPLPTKKRSLTLPRASEEDLLLEEALRLSEQEARLLVRQDHVDNNVQQLDVVDSLLHRSKNMDQIVTSMCELPLAWTMAFCKDMINGGKSTAELADIHLWNRILAANVTDGVARSFHERMSKLELKTGNTRSSYVKYITSVFATLPIAVQKQWELLHCLSGFELLLLSSCPALFRNRNWLHPLVGETSSFLPHNGVELLSNGTLLRLLRSQVGKQLMQALQAKAPGNELSTALMALKCSDVSAGNLPALSVDVLMTTPVPTGTDN